MAICRGDELGCGTHVFDCRGWTGVVGRVLMQAWLGEHRLRNVFQAIGGSGTATAAKSEAKKTLFRKRTY